MYDSFLLLISTSTSSRLLSMLAPRRSPLWAVASRTPSPARPIPCNSQLREARLPQDTYSGEERITRDLRQETTVSALCGNGRVRSTISYPNDGFRGYKGRIASIHTLSTLRTPQQHPFRGFVRGGLVAVARQKSIIIIVERAELKRDSLGTLRSIQRAAPT